MLSETKHLGYRMRPFAVSRDPSFVRMTLGWVAFASMIVSRRSVRLTADTIGLEEM